MTDLPERVIHERIIPVVRNLTPSRATPLVEALGAGDISSIEVTMEGKDAAETIRSLQDHSVIVGAGTVISIAQAEEAIASGAVFLVSPHLDEELTTWAVSSGVPYLPGVFTPTEVARALALGVSAVKLFPASIGGPGAVRALLGPFPGLSVIPTGGINDENARDFIAAGATAVGVGGWLTDHEDLGVVTGRARRLVAALGVA